MWKIVQIFDGEYGCEEIAPGASPKVLVTLRDEYGKEKSVSVEDAWLVANGLDEGSLWPYKFWGWENANAPALESAADDFPGIDNPIDLYDALSHLWCADTCAPRMRANWTKDNMTFGQCSITAFLAQDIFGGEVYGILRSGGNYHCFNVIGDCRFDLTSEQFGEEVLDYEDTPKQLREVHFAKEEKRLRYEALKTMLREYCTGDKYAR